MTDLSGEAARLPARLEVSALVRRVQSEGGFAAVLAKGEPEAGTIMVVLIDREEPARALERMPQPDGQRLWAEAKRVDPADPAAFESWLERRRTQDPDLWIVELDIPKGERFVLPG